MIRPDKHFTQEEARLLDLCLVCHAEHGGGNNSTFTCRSVSSTGTDTYSAIAAAVGSLKGPKHGGANRQVLAQFSLIKQTVRDWKDDDAVADCVRRILRRAVRYGYTYLGFTEPFICKLVAGLVAQMGDQFPELRAQQTLIERVIEEEESSFLRTLATGITLLDGVIAEVKTVSYTHLTLPTILLV